MLKCQQLEASSGGTFRVFKASGVELHADAVEHVWRLLERTLRGQMPKGERARAGAGRQFNLVRA